MTEIGVGSADTASSTTSSTQGAAEATKSTPAITFDRVGVSYGRSRKVTHALVDFNLRVATGETVALLGPSGSGKSTALNALAGFVRPTSGAVRLAGRDVTDLAPAKRGIDVVLQSYALFPHMRVADNVAFGLKSHRVPRSKMAGRVTEALDMVGMAEYGNRLPRDLSGGQQQRVAIARALAIRPKVLLLDEPLAALDAKLRQSMLAELQRLKEALPDTAMLYVTHDQSEALALADRIVVMNNARLMDVDTAENLWKRPPTSFTASFLGGANLIPCTVGRVIGTSALVSIAGKTISAEAPQPAVGRIDCTVAIAVTSTLGCLVLGTFLAIVLAFVPFPGSGLVGRLIDTVLALPSFLITLAFTFLYGTAGALNALIAGLTGSASPALDFLYTPAGVIAAEITFFTPFVVRPLLASFALLPRQQLDVAASLGASPMRVLRGIVMPEAWPALMAGGSLVLLLTLNEFGIVLFTGAKGVMTLPVLIYTRGIVTFDLPGAAVIATVQVLSLVLYISYRAVFARFMTGRHREGAGDAAVESTK